jgi:N-acetylglutamate synthase-like GNAT family acetyltransferase
MGNLMRVYKKTGASLEVTLRPALPDDAPQIINLIKKQHGSGYSNALYDEGFMRRGIEAGALRFVVVELGDGVLAGMGGINDKNMFASSVSTILLTVSPSLRGFGLGEQIHRFLVKTAQESKDIYASVYAHCVTMDARSQTMNYKSGSQMTGIILNRFIIDTTADNLAGLSLPLKHNHLVSCLPLGKQDAGTIYAPPPYAGFINDVYASLKVKYTMEQEPECGPPSPRSLFEFMQFNPHRYCELLIREPSADYGDILDGTLKQYASLEDQTFNAFINLNDPRCPSLCRVMEEWGFFFAGVQPLAGSYEYMILHYSPSLPVPFERIAVVPAFQERLAYIRARYEESRHERIH